MDALYHPSYEPNVQPTDGSLMLSAPSAGSCASSLAHRREKLPPLEGGRVRTRPLKSAGDIALYGSRMAPMLPHSPGRLPPPLPPYETDEEEEAVGAYGEFRGASMLPHANATSGSLLADLAGGGQLAEQTVRRQSPPRQSPPGVQSRGPPATSPPSTHRSPSSPTSSHRLPPSQPKLPSWRGVSVTMKASKLIMQHQRTMFDDGRFLKSLIAEGRSVGLVPVSSAKGGVPPALGRYTKRGISKEPTETLLAAGPDGGGGVRLFPPHLDEGLTQVASSFQLAERR